MASYLFMNSRRLWMQSRIIPLALFLAGTVNIAWAIQNVTAYGDEMLEAEISLDSLNRITVQDDRILNVKSAEKGLQMGEDITGPFQPNTQTFYLDQNPDVGDIFIKPANVNNTSPIDLYITTENRNTFSLSLKPKNIEPQTVRISIPISTANNEAVWQADAPYQQILINLIKVMRLSQSIEGYHIEGIEQEDIKRSKNKDVQLRLLKRYIGHDFEGEVYELANYTSSVVELNESQIFAEYGRDTKSLAVAVNSKSVPSATFTQVYRVVPHGK